MHLGKAPWDNASASMVLRSSIFISYSHRSITCDFDIPRPRSCARSSCAYATPDHGTACSKLVCRHRLATNARLYSPRRCCFLEPGRKTFGGQLGSAIAFSRRRRALWWFSISWRDAWAAGKRSLCPANPGIFRDDSSDSRSHASIHSQWDRHGFGGIDPDVGVIETGSGSPPITRLVRQRVRQVAVLGADLCPYFTVSGDLGPR